MHDDHFIYAKFHSDRIITSAKTKDSKFHRWPDTFVRYCKDISNKISL